MADLLDDAAPPVSLQAALSDLRVYPFVDDNASFPAQPLQSDGADGTPDSNIADGGGGGVPPASTEDADDGGVLAWVLANVVRVDGKERFFCIPLAANWTKRELTNRLGKNGYAVLLAHPQFRNWSKVRTDTIKERHDAKIRAQDPIFQLDANRYVLIYGTTDVCDTKEMGYCGTDGRMPAAALRAALGADRYSAWEDNPNRLQVRVNDFGFFPDSPHGMARKDNVALSEEDRKDPEKLRKTLDIDEENFLSCVNIYDGLPFKQKNICELEKVNHYRDLIFGYESCRNILAAIELLCNHDVRITEWVLNWIAYRLRHPAVKQDTALVFASPVQGAGKSLIFATLLPKIFGRWAGVLGQSDMESQFSGVYENKLYIVYEEVNSPRKRFDLMGRLKNEITGEFIRIEKKGMDTVYQRNYIGFVYLSNYHSPVVPEQNDRRFCIVSPQHKMDEQFAAAVAAEIYDDNAVQDFVDFLYALPLLYTDDFGRRKTYHAHTHAPETDAKKAMKKWNAHPYEVYADDWQSGELGLPYIPCKLDDCFKVFNVWCVMVKEKGMSKERFKMALNHLNGIRVIRTAVEGSQKQVWLVVPPNIKKPDNMPMPRFYLHSADKFARAMSKQSWL
nr:DUF5906 domain-containing protein [Conchiformibius kuhniae]